MAVSDHPSRSLTINKEFHCVRYQSLRHFSTRRFVLA